MSRIAYIHERRGAFPEDLPESYATRWSASKKAAVVRAVQAGVISLSRAMAIYRLSHHEYASWQQSYALSGIPGLRASEQRLTM